MGRKNNSTLISEERIKINIINNKEVFAMNTYRTHTELIKNFSKTDSYLERSCSA